MAPTSSKRSQRITARLVGLRDQLWPTLDEKQLWQRRVAKGFTTVPRTLPLMLRIMNEMSPGKPLDSTYLDLWSCSHEECFVVIKDQTERAFHAGFSGQRSASTWRERIRKLCELRFIDLKSGPCGPVSYVLIWNPYHVIRDHRLRKHPLLQEDSYNALLARMSEVGATDLK